MPIYEFVCMTCEAHFEELVRGDADVACPECGATKVARLWSTINTEWMPSDVAWDRVGRSFD